MLPEFKKKYLLKTKYTLSGKPDERIKLKVFIKSSNFSRLTQNHLGALKKRFDLIRVERSPHHQKPDIAQQTQELPSVHRIAPVLPP